MNPSTEELLRAVEEAPSDEVILLPNNENILLAARQVQALTKKKVAVVPTRDLAQGVAAALAYRRGRRRRARRAKAMGRALESVRTGEVTTAVRAAKLDGFSIKAGDYMGLVGGELAVVCKGLEEAVETVLESAECRRRAARHALSRQGRARRRRAGHRWRSCGRGTRPGPGADRGRAAALSLRDRGRVSPCPLERAESSAH